MTARSTRRLLPLLSALGISAALLVLPVSWPGVASWQYQTRTLTPAAGAGQEFVLELGRPLLVEFPVVFERTSGSRAPRLVADVSILSEPALGPEAVGLRLDEGRSRLQLPMQGIAAPAGTRIRVEVRDPDECGCAWIWASEHDSYTYGERTVDGAAVGGDLAFRVFYRRRLADVLLAGWGILPGSVNIVIATVVTTVGAGILVAGLLRRHVPLDLAALLASTLGGGLFATALLSLVVVVLRLRPTIAMVGLTSAGMGALGLWVWAKSRARIPPLDLPSMGLLLGIVAFGLLNLRFASDLTLPPHVDSSIHYSIVTDLLRTEAVPTPVRTIPELIARYYHLGFHAWAAWILTLAGDTGPIALAVLGQILQTAAVVSVYLTVYLVTRVPKAALGAFALAGIGWTMPAYASNWAKYPALLGLAVFGLVAGLATRLLDVRGVRWGPYGTAALLALGAALMHTRTLLLVAGLVLSVAASRRLNARIPRVSGWRILAVSAAVAVALIGILSLGFPGSLDTVGRSIRSLVDGTGWISSGFVLVLTPFAFRSYRVHATAFVLFAVAILVFLLLPPNGSYPLPLVDEPLAKMVLFLPMSVLGGMGLAGLQDTLRRKGHLASSGIAAFAVVAYAGAALAGRDYAADECCQLARTDDGVVLAQVGQLRPESLVLISTQAGEQTGPSPIDAGAWVLPLAQRRSIAGRSDADLRSDQEHERLCAAGVTHVYAGGMPFSYSRTELDLRPDFYSPIVLLPGAALYGVTGCGASQAPPRLGLGSE